MTIAEEIVLGALLGFATGLTGVGGAALTIPALVFLLGFSTVGSVAVSFPFVAVIKLFGFFQHRRQGTFHLRLSLALLVGSIPATVLGVLVISRLFDRFGEELDLWLNLSIGALIIASISLLLVQTRSANRSDDSEDETFGRPQWLRGVALGFPMGAIIGATSVGAGSIMITLCLIVYRISTAKIVGSSIGVSLALMIVGAVGYSGTDLVDYWAVLYLSIGGVPGVILGSKLINRLPQTVLLRLVALAVVAAGLALIGKGIHQLT